jgi:hypothetical protein
MREAAKRRENAAHGASRGSATTKGEPQRSERLCLIHQHHRKHSFQKELSAFLKKNNVAYEEKYLWG